MKGLSLKDRHGKLSNLQIVDRNDEIFLFIHPI
jgi:hypothetical protein